MQNSKRIIHRLLKNTGIASHKLNLLKNRIVLNKGLIIINFVLLPRCTRNAAKNGWILKVGLKSVYDVVWKPPLLYYLSNFCIMQL